VPAPRTWTDCKIQRCEGGADELRLFGDVRAVREGAGKNCFRTVRGATLAPIIVVKDGNTPRLPR